MIEGESAGKAPQAGPTVLFVGDFSASRLGNHSVAEDLAQRVAGLGWKVHVTSRRPGKVTRAVDMITKSWLLRNRVDVAVIDLFSGPAFRWAEQVSAVLRMNKVPFALVLRGGSLPRFAASHPQRVRRIFRSAARVVALSRYLEEQMKGYAEELTLIPNPLDAGAYTFRLREEAAPNLVWLRSFNRIYNPALAIETLAHLVPRHPEARLSMIGAEKEHGTLDRCRRLAEERGVAHLVEFRGPVSKEQVPQQLARGDILLNTPTTDNVPISVIEAMASGLCVVSTSVGGLPYLIEHESTGLLVPSNDSESMARAVERVVQEPELAGRLSRRGRERALEFDWSAVLPQWRSLLETLARHGRSGRKGPWDEARLGLPGG